MYFFGDSTVTLVNFFTSLTYKQLVDDYVSSGNRLTRRHENLSSVLCGTILLDQEMQGWPLKKEEHTCFNEAFCWDMWEEGFNALTTYELRMAYVRGFFLEELNCDIVEEESVSPAPATQEEVADGVAFAQSFGQRLCEAMTLIRVKAKQFYDATCAAIISQIRTIFDKTLGAFLEVVMGKCKWLDAFWKSMQEHADELIKRSFWFLEGCKEVAVLGLSLLSGVALITMVERFLVVCGILRAPIGLSQLFVPAAVSIFGITALLKVSSIAVHGIVNQLSTLANTILFNVAQFFGFVAPDAGLLAIGQYAPVDVLSSFSEALKQFTGSTLHETGRAAQAVNSIYGTCKNAIDVGKKGIWYLAQSVDLLLGTESAEIQDLGILVGLDLGDWLREIDAMEEQFLLSASSSRELLERATVLYEKGTQVRELIVSGASKPSSTLAAIIAKAFERLRVLKHSLMIQGSNNWRPVPFVVACVGTSRTGKSLLARKIAEELNVAAGMPEGDIYARNTQDAFWTKYRRQTTVMYDDFGALEHVPSDEAELMPIVSSAACPLNMAALEEKGIFFDSPHIVYSSNFEDASPHSSVHDKAAFRNRRNLVIRVKLNGNDYDAGDFTSNQCYEVLSVGNDGVRVVQVIDNYQDLHALVMNTLTAHKLEQEANGKGFSRKSMINKAMTNAWSFLANDMRDLGEYAHQEVPCGADPFMAHAGLLWYVGADNQIGTVGLKRGSLDTPSISTLGKSLETFRLARGTNTLALMYLERLLKEVRELPGYGIDLSVWNQDEPIRDFAASLSLKERVILITCHNEYYRKGREEHSLVGALRQWMDVHKTKLAASIAKWPLIAKAALGLSLVVIGGTIFWKTLAMLKQLCTGAGFMGVAVSGITVCADAQSRAPTRNLEADFRFRNVPLRARRFAQGQAEVSLEPHTMAIKHLVNIRVGNITTMGLILPGKRLVMVNHVARMVMVRMRATVITATGRTLYCTLDPKMLELVEGSELASFVVNQLPQVRMAHQEDILWDSELLSQTGAQATLFVAKEDNCSGGFVFECLSGVAKVRTKAMVVQVEGYSRNVPIGLSFSEETSAGDCGGLLIAKVGSAYKIIGMHVALCDGQGVSCFIPRSWKADGAISYCEGQGPLESFVNFDECENALGKGLSIVGTLKKPLRSPTATKLEEVPKEWQVFPCEHKEPSILVATDPRVPEDVQPLNLHRNGMAKFENPMSELNQELLDEVVQEIVEHYADVGASNFRSTTEDVMLNGQVGCDYFDSIVVGTSEGFPWVYERKHGEKGKARYLEGEPGAWTLPVGPMKESLQNMEISVREGKPIELVGIECPKDELLPLRKIYVKPKTRYFTVLPMEYNLLMRKFTLEFVAWMMKNRASLSCQVGINPYSREWNRMAETLQSNGDQILCCDYSSFDGLCTPQMMTAISSIIGTFYDNPSDKRAISTLLGSIFGRYGLAQSTVYQIYGGIPSGIALTVIVNSMMNEILVRYFWKSCVRPHSHLMSNQFHRFVKMVVYGDDNLISVHPSVVTWFNGQLLQQSMKRFGITITDGVDKTLPTLKFRKLVDCDFLKRGFCVDSTGLWVGPQEKTSLFSQLVYVRTSSYDSLLEAFVANAENVLREMWLHGKEEAARFRKEFLALKLGSLPTLGEIEAFHCEQRGMGLSLRHEAIDCFSNTVLLGSVETTTVEGANIHIIPRCSAAALGQETHVEGNFYVFVGCGKKRGYDGMVVNLAKGTGRGGLPTQYQLEMAFVRKSSEIRKTLYTKYVVEGKNVVFLSPSGNLVGMICALLWLRASSLIDKSMGSVGLQRAVEACASLGVDTDLHRCLT